MAKDFSLSGILAMAQQLQMVSFPTRAINVNTSKEFVNVTVFEKDYDQKEDYDLKNFTFYEFQDDYAREAEWKRLMDYYG